MKSLVAKQEVSKTESVAQAVKKVAASPAAGSKDGRRNPDLFEFVGAGSTGVKVVSLTSGPATKLEDAELFKVPLLLQLDPSGDSIRKLVAKAADGAEKFADSTDRSAAGRQQRKRPGRHATIIDEFAKKLFGNEIVMDLSLRQV